MTQEPDSPLIRDGRDYFQVTGEMPVVTKETDPTIEAIVAHIQTCAVCKHGVTCGDYHAILAAVQSETGK